MHRCHLTSLIRLLPLLLLLAPSTGAADRNQQRDKPQEPAERFSGTASTTLIEVPVNVVDRDGNPVRGLTAADFELWDDGRPQPVDNLETIDLATFRPSRAEAEKAALALPSSARRRFLLLFDFTFSNPNAVVRARTAARQFVLDGLHPTDLAAVATFSVEQGPRLLVTFTSDRAQLARAIETLGVVDLTKRGFQDPLRFFYESPETLSADDLAADSSGNFEISAALGEHLLSIIIEREKAEKNYARNRVVSWSRAMAEFAKALGATAGRKNVVLFTEGFDGSLAFGRDASRNSEEGLLDQQLMQRGQFWLVDQDNTFGSTAIQTQLKEMLEEFRRADTLLQVVDLGGLRTNTDTDGFQRNTTAQKVRDNVDALFYLANTTGGTLFEQGNDVGAKLVDLLDRSGVTYVLGFYPKDLENDGRFRKLRVRLRGGAARGAKLSYRTGYYAPKPYGELHPLERSLLAAEALQTLAPRREIGLSMLSAVFRSGEAKAYVPVVLEIDGKSLLDGQKSGTMGLEIYVYASTPSGEMRDFRTQVVGVDLERQRAAIEKKGIKYYAHLDLPAGEFQLRVMVRNSETGKVAVTSSSIVVPRQDELRAELLPPFFFDAGGEWLMLRERTTPAAVGGEPAAAADSDPALVYPFTVKGQPFVPAAMPRLEKGKKAEFCLVAYGFGKGKLELRGRVLGTDGLPHEVGKVELEERTATSYEGLDKLLASFDPGTLQAGEYRLELTLRHESGLERVSQLAFTVG
jgi:VWFA-related protein